MVCEIEKRKPNKSNPNEIIWTSEWKTCEGFTQRIIDKTDD